MTDVRPILNQVRDRGVAAVLEFTQQFDQVTLTPAQLIYDPFAVEAALPPASDRDAMDFAIQRIRAFHHQTRPQTATVAEEPQISLQERWVAIGRVGIYAPNGRYPLISSLLMTAIPAQAAGVTDLVVAIAPRHQSWQDPHWNYALRQLGIHQVLAAGGAQAIAAMAYGLGAALKPVDLVAGPGNAYVAAAKQQLFQEGILGIDMLAGPSEVLIIADATANLQWVALDLLSQAEHSPDASGILVSWDGAVVDAVKSRVAELSRNAPTQSTLGPIQYRTVASPQAAVDLANQVAPEHLGLSGATAEGLADQILTTGALFIGSMAGQALGDYVAGPSHVLPTQGTGRFLSGLSTRTFMRKMSVIRAHEGLEPVYLDHGATLARLEGLHFHEQALLQRKRSGRKTHGTTQR